MASPTFITRSNYTTLLVRSTQGRSGTPDGNIFIDEANDRIEIITLEENATVDLGGGLEANPLTNTNKIQLLALYFFVLQEVQVDSGLQGFKTFIDAVGNRMALLVGATAFLNGNKLATGGSLGDDRLKLGGSGFNEFAADGNTDRIYHGIKSLGNIDPASQAFFQVVTDLAEGTRQSVATTDFSKLGDIDEVIQTFGSTSNGDASAGDFDSQGNILILGVRTFGFSVGEVESETTGVTELGAYQQGYGLTQNSVSELSSITEADVFGGSQVAPYTGLSLSREAVPQVETGFSEPDGNFTDIVLNTGGATLIQIRAWLDMLMQQETDQNANTGSTGPFLPKRAEPLYTINSNAQIVTRQGVFIENVPTEDQQSILFTDDAGDIKGYPFNVGINVRLSASWFNDPAPWFKIMFEDGAGALDFNTSTAVTVDDASSVAVSGNQLDARIVPVGLEYELRFSFAYDTQTQAGLIAATDKNLVVRVGGTTATKERTVVFQVTRVAAIPVDATTQVETN